MDKKQLEAIIDKKQDEFIEIADSIWDYAELSLKEFKSAKLYVEALEKEGFEVTTGLSNIETAFKGVYGSGKPVIGILGEFDALSGLAQVGGSVEKCGIEGKDSGHGCQHNLLGAGSFAAAVALKEYIKEEGKGTVIFYGCPGEEGGAAKAFMARDNEFSCLDIAITWHPSDVNQVVTGSCNSSIQVEYTFEGVSAHAAGNPEAGRSALDAVQLMNMGVEFLREHVPSYARMHYAITNAGGISPNVVPAKASVLYMVRCGKVKETIELLKRVDKIAEGASMMTDTTLTRRFIDGTSDTISNKALEEVLYKNFKEVELPTYTTEEIDFATRIGKTIPKDKVKEMLKSQYSSKIIDEIIAKTDNATSPLADFLVPYEFSDTMSMGSTDVGDVSYLAPTSQINTVCTGFMAPGHSWQNVSFGKSSIAYKGMLTAAKVMADTAVDLINDPELVEKIKAEYKQRTAGGYDCPIEKDAIPQVI